MVRATLDKAGRLVIPKVLRDRLGLRPGEVEVSAQGAALRVEAPSSDEVIERHGRLLLPGSGATVDDEIVRELRDSDQR